MNQSIAIVRREVARREFGQRRGRVHHHAQGQARFRRYRESARRLGRRVTLLALVQEVQRHFENDADVVRAIRYVVNSGAVVLIGNFAGSRF
jgi:hypothetical protein